jgi:tetratricopeptide (TPR) repeat protein
MTDLPHPDNQHFEAAEGWLGLGDHLAANEELEQITPAWRAHPFVLELRYTIYSKAGNWELAAEIARTLSEMLPDNSWGFIHYAFSLHELKRTREAYGVLIPVADHFSEPTIRYNLACYSSQLGNLAEAMQWLEKAIDLAGKKDIRRMALADPDLAPLWSKIGDL